MHLEFQVNALFHKFYFSSIIKLKNLKNQPAPTTSDNKNDTKLIGLQNAMEEQLKHLQFAFSIHLFYTLYENVQVQLKILQSGACPNKTAYHNEFLILQTDQKVYLHVCFILILIFFEWNIFTCPN